MSGPAPAPEAELRETISPEETGRLGSALATGLAVGDVILLTGPLGAGKTCFVTGLARGLGCVGRVRSPSFTLVNEYGGAVPLFHLDLYRLEGRDVDDLGLEERLERGVLAVEWGERLPAHLCAEALTLVFEIRSERRRAIRATAAGARGLELLAAWRALDARTEPSR
jgi:tRNA threonylcarbamoyladenosine biosynthesis protein TsaE